MTNPPPISPNTIKASRPKPPEEQLAEKINTKFGTHIRVKISEGSFQVIVPKGEFARSNFLDIGFQEEDIELMKKQPSPTDTWDVKGAASLMATSIWPSGNVVAAGFGNARPKTMGENHFIIEGIATGTPLPTANAKYTVSALQEEIITIPENLVAKRLPEMFAAKTRG